MTDAVTKARQDLAIAQAEAKRLWAEYSAYGKTLPRRGVIDGEEWRRLQEASEWQGKIYAAEHAVFRAEHGTPGIVGSNGPFQWLTMVDQDITALLEICPEFAVDRYVAVTSFDSGPLRLTEREKDEGWRTGGRFFHGTSWNPPEYQDDWQVACSPRIRSIHELPNETHPGCCDGFAEWYVFDQPVPTEDIESFVNWMGFRLYDPGFGWCADRFWSQMARINPEHYVAEGTVFTVVTRNAAVFDRIVSGFSE